jgi:hypothetical protein
VRIVLFALLLVADLSAGQKTKAELQEELLQTRAALHALDQQAGVTTGADADAENCEVILRSLLDALSKLSSDGHKDAAGLLQQVNDVHTAVQNGHELVAKQVADSAEAVTSEVRLAQNQNAGVAQRAVTKATEDAHTNLTTQVIGFLLLIGTYALKEYSAGKMREQTARKIDRLAQAIAGPAEGTKE